MEYFSPWWIRWMTIFCGLSQARIAPYKNTSKHLQNTVYWCNSSPAQERGLRFYETKSDAAALYDTLPLEFIEKAVCMKTGEQLYQRKAKDHVLRSKQIRNVNHKIYLVKKQDHLGKHKAKCEAFGSPDATSWTTESQDISQRFKSRMNKNDKQSPS